MLTKYPENKEVRGIMKLVNRQKDKNNGFKLTYEAELTDRTEQETLEEWLRRERQWQKSRKQNMKLIYDMGNGVVHCEGAVSRA